MNNTCKIMPYEKAKQIRRKYREDQAEYRDNLYLLVQEIAINAVDLHKDKSEFNKFINDPFWKGCKSPPKIGQNETLLRHLLWFIYGKSDNQRKRAWRHAKLVSYLYSKGVKPEKLYKKIKSIGGWNAIDKKRKAIKNQEAIQASVESDTVSSKTKDNSKSSKTMIDLDDNILVESDSEIFNQLMELKKGKEVSCTIKALGKDKKGFRQLKIKSLKKK